MLRRFSVSQVERSFSPLSLNEPHNYTGTATCSFFLGLRKEGGQRGSGAERAETRATTQKQTSQTQKQRDSAFALRQLVPLRLLASPGPKDIILLTQTLKSATQHILQRKQDSTIH